MPNLHSQNPDPHDNTEKDIIWVTPMVLDNKLRDFEQRVGAKDALVGEVALAVTLIVAFITINPEATFLRVDAPTLRGAFGIAFLLTLGKIGYDLFQLWRGKRDGREELIRGLLKPADTPKNHANQKAKSNNRGNR